MVCKLVGKLKLLGGRLFRSSSPLAIGDLLKIDIMVLVLVLPHQSHSI